MAPKSPAAFLYNFLGRAAQDPRNYRFLQEAAGDVLSRVIPKGVNWGGLPGQFLNTLDDISRMAPGAAKEAARTNAKTTLTRAAVSPPSPSSVRIGPGGLPSAPPIGTPVVRPPVTARAPSTPLPGGGPFNIDYALRRATGFNGSPAQIAEKLGIPLTKPKPTSFSMPMEGMLGPSSPLGQITAKTSMFARAPQSALQTGVGQVGGLLRNLQGRIPTALNPFATQNPTTLLGRTGKFFNPLNPGGPFNLVNTLNPVPGISVGTRLASSLGLTGAAGLGTSVAGGLAGYGALEMLFPQGTADGTLEGKDAYRNNYMPFGGDPSLRDAQGRIWAGKDYGFQSPESFNKLFSGAQQTTAGGASPPPPTLPPSVDPGSQAGQLITPPTLPPAAPAAPGGPTVLSNGAGVPAQRQNVKERQLSQDVLNAAQQYAAPAGIPLSSFYAGQQQLGRSMEQGGELQRRLKELGGAAGMSDQALMAWAQKNPGLAYRELLKLQNRTPQM